MPITSPILRLDAYEEKRFEQYFLPYHSLGMVQNASRDAVIKLQRSERGLSGAVCHLSVERIPSGDPRNRQMQRVAR
ncbi:hypothetical protein FA039_18855 [Escherichia coli]|nr:hypothetical protein [Escherichia coli]